MPPDADARTPQLRTPVQVMFFDTDSAGVVHNIAYLRLIETNRTLLAAQLGLALRDLATTQIYPVVVRTEIDYRAPAVLADDLWIDGWLESVGRARFWCAFEVRRASDQALLVTARQQLAIVQMPQGKPLRLPAEWAVRYAHLRES